MNRTILCGTLILAMFAIAATGLYAADEPPKPPPDDMEVRELDVLILEEGDARWEGEFRRDEKGFFEVLPNGKWLFDIKKGKSKGISLKVFPREVKKYLLKQSDEEVERKKHKKLPTGRLDVPKYLREAARVLEKGYLDLAEDLLRRAHKIDDKSFDVYMALGDLFRRRLKLNDEVVLYQTGLKAKLTRPEGLLARFGDLLSLLSLHAEAEARFKEALLLDKRHLPSLLGLGKLYMKLRRFEEASDRLALAAKDTFDKEKKGEVLKWLGKARLKLGDIEGAKKAFEDAVFQLPDDLEVKNYIGATYYLTGDSGMAKQKFMEVLGIDESDLDSGLEGGGGEEGSEEGEEGEGEGEGEGEEGEEKEGPASPDEWEPATEFDPFKSKAMANLALCLMREGMLSSCENYIRLSAGLDPTSGFPWIILGYLREQQQHFSEAMSAYEKALAIEPRLAFAHYSIGILHLRGGDEGSARTAFLAAADADPDFTDAMVKLGRLAARVGQGAEAVLYYQRAIALCPGVADWHVGLGIAHAYAGDHALGGEQFKKALALDPSHPIARVAVLFSLYYAPKGDEEAYLKMKNFLDDEADTLPEPIRNYLKEIKNDIETNRGKVQWKDDFDRPDTDQVARKWEQREGRGPVVRIHRGRGLIDGAQLRAGETVLEREVPAEKFVRLEADIHIRDIANFEGGVGITHRYSQGARLGDLRGGVRLGKNAKGKLVLWEWDVSSNRWRENKDVSYGDWPVTETGWNRLGIEIFKDVASGRDIYLLRFTLNGNPLGDPFESDRFRRKIKSGEIWAGVFAAADEKGTNVKVEVDNVRLVTWK